MNDLAHFKGLLDKCEQTGKQNAQLKQEVANLRERVQDFGKRTTICELQWTAADSHVQDTEPTISEIDDSQSQVELRETSKPEVSHKTPSTELKAVDGLLAELPYEIGLVEGIAEDGAYEYRNHALTPPAKVTKSLVEYVARAHECRGRTKNSEWGKWFTSTHACAASTLWAGSSHWVEKTPGKYCRRGCFVQKRACVFFDHQAQKLAVLPLPPSMRLRGCARH